MNSVAHLNAALTGRYAIEREVGVGGMATVYLARDVRHDRLVAIKVLRDDDAIALGAERFFHEIRTTANLQHPHILPLLDSGRVPFGDPTVGGEGGRPAGQLYYVTPYVAGETLRARLDREGSLPAAEALALARQIALALDYAHRLGVVHRDVKPENILLADGLAIVADFGIALAVSHAGGERLTQIGMSLGTPAYMAPEQVVGDRAIDGRTDQYSLACVLYELLCGRPPFSGATAQATMVEHVVAPVPPLVITRGSVPAAVEEAVRRALAKDPADRFATTAEFGAALNVSTASGPALSEAQPSLVVLPFANLSPDPADAFFADGLTDEVITDLSRVRALRVISRNSTMLLKGATKDTRSIAREVGVRHVLEGTVRRAGNALRVTTRLTDAVSDMPLWAEKYTGTVDDVFDVQERLSREIVEALKVTLTPEEDRRLAARPVPNVHAYECYLKAQREILSFTADGFERAFALLDRGLELAGENALLYAARSYAYTHLIGAGFSHDDANLDRAEEDARRALALDPEVAQAHFALGYAAAQRGDLARAFPHFRRAEVLDPTSADTAFWYGAFLTFAGCNDEARQRVERLRLLAPNADIVFELGLVTATATGDWEAALAEWDRMLARGVAPDAYSVNSVALLVLRTRRAADGIAHLEQADDVMRATVIWRNASFIARAYAGDEAGALALADDEHLSVARRDSCVAWLVASGYALLGHVDTALEWLGIAAERGFLNHRFLADLDPFFVSLRDDPRFVAYLARMQRMQAALST